MDPTVDPREVEFYGRLATTWWDESGPLWPLHTLNRLRIDYIRRHLCAHFERNPDAPAPLAGLRVLDVGCGGGILSESLARLGAEVTGIDVVPQNIEVGRLHASEANLRIDYRVQTAAQMAEAGEHFDVVLSMEVVEHVADLAAFLRDCCRLTASGGALFIATINRTLLAWLIAIIGAEYVLRWLPRGTHRWRWFRKPAELRDFLRASGIETVETVGVAVNPLTRRMRLTRLHAVNYMMYCVRRPRNS